MISAWLVCLLMRSGLRLTVFSLLWTSYKFDTVIAQVSVQSSVSSPPWPGFKCFDSEGHYRSLGCRHIIKSQ